MDAAESAFGRGFAQGRSWSWSAGAAFSGSTDSACAPEKTAPALQNSPAKALHQEEHLVQLPQELPAEPLPEPSQTGSEKERLEQVYMLCTPSVGFVRGTKKSMQS